MSCDWMIQSTVDPGSFIRMGFDAKAGEWHWEWADRKRATAWPTAQHASNVIREFVTDARAAEFCIRHRSAVSA